MVHYHGTPIGGSRIDTSRFLLTRHALVPFSRPDDMPIVADKCQSFILDNGAYTVYKKGGELDYAGYVEFVSFWHKHPNFDWALIPDVIGGTEEENDDFINKWPKELKGVPVYHMHESFERLIRLIENNERIALGSSGDWPTPNAEKWWLRMADIMDVICDAEGRPKCKLHGLRMLNPEVFKRLPLSSADSTNAARNNCMVKNFGMYPPPTTAQRTDTIASTIEVHNCAPVWVRSTQTSLF